MRPSRNYRYFCIGGITIRVTFELPITDTTFSEKFNKFRVSEPGNDTIRFMHRFSLPDIRRQDLTDPVYKKPPWEIYHRGNFWLYLGILPGEMDSDFHKVAIFNENHTNGIIYSPDNESYLEGKLNSLTMFPTDQIILARVFADREACYFHSAGMILYGRGVLFIGHSEAGKSTTVTMLKDEGLILCDDRIVVRRWPEGFRIHGTWSHGEVSDVSNSSAPLYAIFLLEKADTNEILPFKSRNEIIRMLPFYVVKPIVTADWWEKTLDLIEKIACEVPVYRLKLDKSGQVKTILKEFLQRQES